MTETAAFRELMAALGARKVEDAPVPVPEGKPPFYPKLLRLKNVHPNAWQRALLGEGMAVAGYLLSPGGLDIAPFWAIPVLPLAMAAVVKGHDLLAGQLPKEEPAMVLSVGEEAYELSAEQVAVLQAL